MLYRQLKPDEITREGDMARAYGAEAPRSIRPQFVGLPARVSRWPVLRRRTILVLGHGGHGKGEVCRLLTEIYGAVCPSSSEVAAEIILPALNAVCAYAGEVLYASAAEAYAERRNCRDLWAKLISLYNAGDKSRLARDVLARGDVYDGMRCREEFEAAKHLFDHVIWVDASRRLGGAVDPTMAIPQAVAHFTVDNNGTLDDLRRHVDGLIGRIAAAGGKPAGRP